MYKVTTWEKAPAYVKTDAQRAKFLVYGRGDFGEDDWASFNKRETAIAYAEMMNRQQKERLLFDDKHCPKTAEKVRRRN